MGNLCNAPALQLLNHLPQHKCSNYEKLPNEILARAAAPAMRCHTGHSAARRGYTTTGNATRSGIRDGRIR